MITGYHAHVYFDESTVDLATQVCERARDKFDLKMGRVHQKLVGPHPRWSCQLIIDKNKFGRVVPWLAVNRQGLTILIHPETGDDIKDHTEYAIWMGEVLDLDLSALS